MLKISIIFCLEIHFVNFNLAPDCSYTKFGQKLSICSQDIERKQNFGVNQGP